MHKVTVKSNQNVCLFTNEELLDIHQCLLDSAKISELSIGHGTEEGDVYWSAQSARERYLAAQIDKFNLDRYKRI